MLFPLRISSLPELILSVSLLSFLHLHQSLVPPSPCFGNRAERCFVEMENCPHSCAPLRNLVLAPCDASTPESERVASLHCCRLLRVWTGAECRTEKHSSKWQLICSRVESKNIYPAGKRQYGEGTVPMKRKRRNYPIGRRTTPGFSCRTFSVGKGM
mgnify:CR=1 FL=1